MHWLRTFRPMRGGVGNCLGLPRCISARADLIGRIESGHKEPYKYFHQRCEIPYRKSVEGMKGGHAAPQINKMIFF